MASASEPNPDVAQAETEVEANLIQLADREKAVDARVEQQDFIEDGKTRPPRVLKPTARSTGETRKGKNEEVAPVSMLFPGQPDLRHKAAKVMRTGNSVIKSKPGPVE